MMTNQQKKSRLNECVYDSGIVKAIVELQIGLNAYQQSKLVDHCRYLVSSKMLELQVRIMSLQIELEDLIRESEDWEE